MARATLVACATSGKDFKASPSQHRSYCSVACYRDAQRAGLFKRGHKSTTHRQPCTCCGVEVIRLPTVDRRGNRCAKIFCSRACYDRYRVEQRGSCVHCGERLPPGGAFRTYCSWICRLAAKRPTPRPCVNCGCIFVPVKPMRRPNGIKYIAHNGGKTCSVACERAWRTNNEDRKRKIGDAFRGPNHPNWQGGKSHLNNIGFRGPGWARARARALKRDGHRCVDCGLDDAACRARFGRSLDVDHIVPFHNFGSVRKANALRNLATRCASCHRRAEAQRTNIQMILPLGTSERARHRGRACGERHPKARLTERNVLDIRRRLAAGESGNRLADEYGVNHTNIYAIKKRKTWRHLPS